MSEFEARTTTQPEHFQNEFDLTIGRLDRVLSKLVGWGRVVKQMNAPNPNLSINMDVANQQTLKHHAEDMIAAGHKILKDLGVSVEGTPQP